MKRYVPALICCLAVMASLSSSALAQKGGKGGKGGGGDSYSLSLSVSPGFVTERHGPDAAIGTVSRDNPDLSQPATVSLTSSDTSEATVPTEVVIPENAASVDFYIDAVDDGLEDGVQTVTLTAEASGFQSATTGLQVKNDESLPAIEYEAEYIAGPAHLIGSLSVFNDINNLGECVGYWRSPDDGLNRACGYFPGRLSPAGQAIDLTTLDIAGIPAGYVLGSAVGINDFGQVVGYLTAVDTSNQYENRRGFLLDTTAEVLTLELLPDDNPAWKDTYARKINNNGDILGHFVRADDTEGAYLYHPKDDEANGLEIIDSVSGYDASINPALNGEPTLMVATDGQNGIIYAKGVGVIHQYDDPVNYTPYINDLSTVFGSTWAQVEVQVRKNKTELQDIQVLFKDTGPAGGIHKFTEFDGVFRARGINAADTLITWEGFLHTETDGWIDVYDLVTGTAEERSLLLDSLYSLQNYRQSDVDVVMGYGDVAFQHTVTDGLDEWVILTPRQLP
jgi:hypothetical protein